MMGSGDGGLSGWMTAPVVLAIAATLAVLVLALLATTQREMRAKAVVSAVVLALGTLAVLAVIDRMTTTERAAERRALYDREAALARVALTPGSPLSCLAATAGETAENACERMVFASPQSAAAAVAYMGARLHLLEDGAALAARDEGVRARLAATRRAIELDRFGLAAQVLSARGCTPDKCAAFALLDDTSVLKANLKAQAFDQYVSRYAAGWTAPARIGPPEGASAAPAAPEAPAATPALPEAAAATGPPPYHPLSSKYTLPSSDSIPPVSIMNAEPPLPKGADTAAPAAKPGGEATPVPPKRPQAQTGQAAAPPPTR